MPLVSLAKVVLVVVDIVNATFNLCHYVEICSDVIPEQKHDTDSADPRE